MNIKEKKEKLINNEIAISDLDSSELEQLKNIVKKDLDAKRLELSKLNEKIKEMKTKIDNLVD